MIRLALSISKNNRMQYRVYAQDPVWHHIHMIACHPEGLRTEIHSYSHPAIDSVALFIRGSSQERNNKGIECFVGPYRRDSSEGHAWAILTQRRHLAALLATSRRLGDSLVLSEYQ